MLSKQLLAKIHIAVHDLGLSDPIYRDILLTQFRARSSKELNGLQAAALLDHFRKLGWREERKTRTEVGGKRFEAEKTRTEARGQDHKNNASNLMPRTSCSPKKYDDLGPRDPYAATPGQMRKIEAMWHEVCYAADELAGLRKFLYKTVGVSDVRFLTKRKAFDAIEAIKAIKKRKRGGTHGQAEKSNDLQDAVQGRGGGVQEVQGDLHPHDTQPGELR